MDDLDIHIVTTTKKPVNARSTSKVEPKDGGENKPQQQPQTDAKNATSTPQRIQPRTFLLPPPKQNAPKNAPQPKQKPASNSGKENVKKVRQSQHSIQQLQPKAHSQPQQQQAQTQQQQPQTQTQSQPPIHPQRQKLLNNSANGDRRTEQQYNNNNNRNRGNYNSRFQSNAQITGANSIQVQQPIAFKANTADSDQKPQEDRQFNNTDASAHRDGAGANPMNPDSERSGRWKKRTFESYIPSNLDEVMQRQAEYGIRSKPVEEFKVLPNNELFSEMKVTDLKCDNQYFVKNLQEMGITQLTRIQTLSYNPIMSGTDVLMKSETGSGKTLAFVIPLIQQLISDTTNPVTRDKGTFAIILAPTRELSIQIQNVAQRVARPFPLITIGTLMGGEKKKSEKARLRKGVTIVIATPGRLLDHLQHTTSFKLDNLKHLIFDEADRLLDLGFEKSINQILSLLSEKRKLQKKPQSVLVSATLSAGIRRLASVSLTNPTLVGFSTDDKEKPAQTSDESAPDSSEVAKNEDTYSVPSSLRQNFVMVPCKLRLVTLAAILRWKTSPSQLELSQKPAKIVVFLSCCDSVEFHHALFTRTRINMKRNALEKLKKKSYDEDATEADDAADADSAEADAATNAKKTSDDGDDDNEEHGEEEEEVDLSQNDSLSEPLFQVPVFKLHGDLNQQTRTKIYFEFQKAESGILLCTDVAARGLDLPGVNWIIQYDTPGEPKDYLHRIGRTARLGVRGDALIFLMPHEIAYKELLEKRNLTLNSMSGVFILEHLILAFKRQMNDPIEAAAYLQNIFEYVVEHDNQLHGLAVNGFKSTLRAYSTHTRESKYIFHIKNLHLGHVAKSFAMKDKPSNIGSKSRVETEQEPNVAAAAANRARERKKKKKLTPADRLKQYKDFKSGLLQLRPKIDARKIMLDSKEPAEPETAASEAPSTTEPESSEADLKKQRKAKKAAAADLAVKRGLEAVLASSGSTFSQEELEEELFMRTVKNIKSGSGNYANAPTTADVLMEDDDAATKRAIAGAAAGAANRMKNLSDLLKNPYSTGKRKREGLNAVSEFDAGNAKLFKKKKKQVE